MNIENKNKKLLGCIVVIIIIVIVGIILINRIPVSTGLKKGYISLNEDSSDLLEELFYSDENENVYINLLKLNDCTSADVIRSQGLYVLSTIKNQIIINPSSDSYYINSIKFDEDLTYLSPLSINGHIYADCNKLFNTLGYDTFYQYNYDQSTIELKLTESPGFNLDTYTRIKTSIKNEIPELETKEQIEDQGILPSEASEDKPAIPVLPEATEVNKENIETHTTEFLKEEIKKEIKEEGIKEEDISIQTEEEFKEERWMKNKESLTEVFKTSTPNFEQNAFAELGENGLCFNRANGAIYGNTITVLKDTIAGYFMSVSISADWSDQANNVVTEQSKAYYQGLEELYRKTLVIVLGEKEGAAFFEYLKVHADQMRSGGYISQYDENGLITSVWSDGMVGDGIQASTLELEPWINRYTDDGLRYDIIRNGDGINIIIF